MPYCTRCGSVLPENAKFCLFCGVLTRISTVKETPTEKFFFFLSGLVVGVPVALFFESISHLWFTTLGVATLVAPIVEEFAKADPLFYRQERTGRSLMILGLLSGLVRHS